MPGLTCNACNKEFLDDADQKLHYKSEWHRYNLKRKNETPMLYSCGVCGKDYRSSMAYSQHLKSRAHIMQASQGTNHPQEENAIIKPLPRRAVNKPPQSRDKDDEESEEEWEEVDPEEELVGQAANSLNHLNVIEHEAADQMVEDEEEEEEEAEELDPCCCLMCDLEHDTIVSCMVHMHKLHGFFIPDVEYLKDPEGLLTYLGLKVKKDFMCLYCNERCHPFSSLEAVRKHMAAKGHCKVHYGDGDEDEEAELEEFYDYSSSYVDESGKQLVAAGDTGNSVELVGGSELVITKRSGEGKTSKTLGSREYLRYYRQKPRPSPANNMAITAALASRYRSMGIETVQSREQIVRMKVMKAMNRKGAETMRTKVGMKNNVIRNLPKNVPY
ncbi:ZNF622 protein [Hibiscus syriacus]|uniref:ZNF622 protein n=1 Tax=Hibiscus syriacus TaxID=106335 RepID=A0A6A2YT08_HIBSY|nr:ZNF622 protein [Hibiscus syriacus]